MKTPRMTTGQCPDETPGSGPGAGGMAPAGGDARTESGAGNRLCFHSVQGGCWSLLTAVALTWAVLGMATPAFGQAAGSAGAPTGTVEVRSALVRASTEAGEETPAPANAQVFVAPQEVRVGVLAYMGIQAADESWQSTQAFLDEALPQYRVRLRYYDLEGLRQAAEQREVDFVLTNPGQYAELELDIGASRIATLVHSAHTLNGLSLGSVVIAAARREDLVRLDDMRGQVLAATTSEGFGGYQIVWRELAALGIDPGRKLAGTLFVGFPMGKVLDAVERGEADVGIVRACLLESMPGWRQRFRVLSPRSETGLGCVVSTRLYPDWPIARLRHTSPAVAKDMAVALLQMPENIKGVSWTVPADYQAVHELFRELQIGPYAYLREHSLLALAKRYWAILALIAVALLAWLFYTLRVEHLIHARTNALRHALQERKAIEARMRANQEQVDHMSRLSILGELSTTLAHELSQPLAGIANYGQSLLRRLDNGRLTDAAVREAATEISHQADNAAGVLGRIRAFARKRVSVREPRHLATLVHDTVALFCGMLAQAPVIHIHDGLAPDTQVDVDALQIQQVLLNLLKNGLDAMRNLPEDARCIDISLSAKGRQICIAVRDYGVGLTSTQRQHLFEPFYTSKENGLGLGLSICNSIAEAHGGKLTAFAPDHGSGMVFSLLLPVYD